MHAPGRQVDADVRQQRLAGTELTRDRVEPCGLFPADGLERGAPGGEALLAPIALAPRRFDLRQDVAGWIPLGGAHQEPRQP